jgi:hypothetical protein
MSVTYENENYFYNKNKNCAYRYLAAFGMLLLTTYLVSFIYNLKKNYRFTSDDFIMSKINEKKIKH